MGVRVTYNNSHQSTNAHILHTSKSGAYYLQRVEHLFSKFEGWHVPIPHADGWDMLKICDPIVLPDVDSVDMQHGALLTNNARQDIQLQDNSLLITTQNYTGEITIPLDIRYIYDFDSFGRMYSIEEKLTDRQCVLRYTKREDGNAYTYYLAIKSSHPLLFGDDWQERVYTMDAQRNAHPSSWYVNTFIKTHVKGTFRLQMAVGSTKDEAIQHLGVAFNHNQSRFVKQDTIDLANHFAQKSLDALHVAPLKNEGIYAGYPWFFQFWTRDEAISLGAFIVQKKWFSAKKILLRQLTSTLEDGRLSNRYPHSLLGSADGIGWCAYRILQLYRHNVFSHTEKEDIYATLLKQKELLEKNYMANDLIHNEALETWVDTGKDEDQRDGYCIEIQLLHQRLNDLLFELAHHLGYPYNRVNRTKHIKELFFVNGNLADRLDNNQDPDMTLRINGFIAYYLYPELLHVHEWEQYFDNLLQALWLDWGGLASIDTSHPLFCDNYSGQTNESYHRGDSWYFLNNMAAWCLLHLNRDKYGETAQKLLDASAHEILFMGALGHHAEVSSAAQQESQGCLSQAWSAALFIEAYKILRAK